MGEVVSPFAARRRLSDDTSARLVWNLNWAVRLGMPVCCHSRAALSAFVVEYRMHSCPDRVFLPSPNLLG